MNKYVIVTDSSADLPVNMVNELGLHVIPLSFSMDGTEYRNYPDEREMNSKEFYDLLRQGHRAITSAINIEDFIDFFKPLLEEGNDILYLGFSTGLSCTSSNGSLASIQLYERYPDRKIYCVDTLCASAGQGMLVYNTAIKQREGATIDEARDYAEKAKINLAHWFTVDDLAHLKRGGRVSSTVAVLGTVLQIKPVMHCNDEGKLILVSKARGRKMALKRLAEIAAENIVNPEEQEIFISHSDCLEDAELIRKLVTDRIKVKAVHIAKIGPVIGAHCGPGTIALFYYGKCR